MHIFRSIKMMLAGAAFVALFAPQANAALLYENPAQLGQELLPSGVRLNEEGGCQFNTACGFGQAIVATEFSLAGASTVNSIGFFAVLYRGNETLASVPTGVDWKIYNDLGTTPGSLLASGNNFSYTLGPQQNGTSFSHFEYAVDISDLALNAGTYWLAFQLISTESDIFWSYGHKIASDASSIDDGTTWSVQSSLQGNAITVYGNDSISVVPLPPSAILFGTALLGLAGLRRRKRKAA